MKLALLLLPMAILWSAPAYAQELWVQVRESIIRKQPLFYASPVSTVRYGDRVQQVSEEKGWVRVRSSGREGFLPIAAVTPQQIVLSGRVGSKVQADASEVVLAGKGFSKEVEEQYKRSDAGARFDLVDQVERQSTVSPASVHAFVKSGGLKG